MKRVSKNSSTARLMIASASVRIGSGLRLRSVFTASVLSGRRDVVVEREVHAHARVGRLEAPASGDRDELAAQREATLAVSVLARAADRERGGLLLAVHDGQVERVVERPSLEPDPTRGVIPGK